MNWSEASAKMAKNGAPLNVMGYCMIAFDLAKPVWVQSDIVPQDNRTVLTFEPGAKTPVWPGYWDFNKWYDLEGKVMKNITHWMEFPEPPKSSESF